MNKDQLIDKVVDKTRYPKYQVKKCLEVTLDVIIETLKNNEKVVLVGFGGFKKTLRKSRKGVDPRTGKKIQIPAVKVTKFKAGKRLKEAVKQ
ncbi:MAG: HU family DNA-binding protein [Candidatus Omnitrophica bacterium]|nr:HU family DNA-binding protein [Candidatus Omnitrophota bacterium]